MTKQRNCNAALKGASNWRFEWKNFLKQWEALQTTKQKNYIAKGNSITFQ